MTTITSVPASSFGPHVHSEPIRPKRDIAFTEGWQAANNARKTFIEKIQSEFRDGTLSANGKELAQGSLTRDAQGAPGMQVSTFAVDGFQAKDIAVIQRVPPSAEGTNFLLYVPEEPGPSFHEFNTREEMTAWVKEQAHDPEKQDTFAAHFAPQNREQVKTTLTQFADNDVNAVVGSYGYEKGDIFTRLNKDVTEPPAPVRGLSNTSFDAFDRNGHPIYKGYLQDGTKVTYNYDPYGNLQGASGENTRYFVRNGLNNYKPLVPMTEKQWAREIHAQTMDNVGANDRAGMFHEFIRQLRNPGEGIGTALIAFGVPSDVAYSIEEIVKNPVKGTLLQLNHGNRLGKLLGVRKDAMDNWLEKVGDETQSRIPRYGAVRDKLNTLADILEKYGPPAPDTDTKVTV